TVAGLQVIDALRPSPQLIVELRLARVVRARREDAVGDRPSHHYVFDTLALEALDAAVLVERTLGPRQAERQHFQSFEARRRRVDEVGEDEERNDQVDLRPPEERYRKPDRANDQRRPEAFPEPIDERDQREMVVLEAEPAVAREPLHPEGLVPGLMSVNEDE